MELLLNVKEQLTKPFDETRRKYLIVINVVYVVMAIFYLTSEKISTGSFVPHIGLLFIYIPAILVNGVSLVYNYRMLRKKSALPVYQYLPLRERYVDQFFAWASFGPILIQSFLNMYGYGNPSNDSLITDFALAQSLVICTMIILGRIPMYIWSGVVGFALFYNVDRLGWSYQYHYLTPSEASRYEQALIRRDPAALERQAELNRHGLNPPTVSRYFNIWFVFLVVAVMTAHFYGGIFVDTLKIVPSVVKGLEQAISISTRDKWEMERQQAELVKSSLRITRYQATLEKLNEEVTRLGMDEKKQLYSFMHELRSAIKVEREWQRVERNFEELQSEFLTTLQTRYPNLTRVEAQVLAFIRLGIRNQDMASLMDVQPATIRKYKMRVKQKLGLQQEGLDDFVKKFLESVEEE